MQCITNLIRLKIYYVINIFEFELNPFLQDFDCPSGIFKDNDRGVKSSVVHSGARPIGARIIQLLCAVIQLDYV